MQNLEQTLLADLRELGVERCRLTVGVSGGADSVALLRAVLSIQSEIGVNVCVGHVDHGLRDASADDAAWVADLAARHGVPVAIREAHVAELVARGQGGIEETARRERYRLLTEIAREHDSPFLAVAHTADDQAETILHHLVRGTGLRGLRGMPKSRDMGSGILLIRPLLAVRRREIQSYLADLGQEHREDGSNDDLTFTRNRIRATLLPLLRDEFNPRVEEAVLRIGAQAGACQELIDSLVKELLERAILDRQPDHVRIDCSQLPSASRPLICEALQEIWRCQAWPLGGMTMAHWEQLAALADQGREGEALQLPGKIDARRRGILLAISRTGANAH